MVLGNCGYSASILWRSVALGQDAFRRILIVMDSKEFAFYLEYPGQTDQFPSTYWCGTYQDGNSSAD